MMSTANGVVSAAVVTLGQVRVGDVDVYDVEAAVVAGRMRWISTFSA